MIIPTLWLDFVIYNYVSPNSSVLNINVRLVAVLQIQMFYQNNKWPRNAVGLADSFASLFLEIEVAVEFRTKMSQIENENQCVRRSCGEGGGSADSGSFKPNHLMLSLLGEWRQWSGQCCVRSGYSYVENAVLEL